MDKNNNVKKDNRVLSHIDNGAIDYYFGLKFETKYNYDKLAELIYKKTEDVLTKYYNRVKLSFKNGVEESIKNLGLEKDFFTKDTANYNENNINKNKPINTEIENIKLELTDKGFNIHAIPTIQNRISELIDKSNASYEQSKTVYGGYYANTQKRIILPPFKIILNNGEIVYTESILYIFKNKSAVLRLTIPLKNVDSQPLYTNCLDDYISEITDECGINITPITNTIDALKASYINFFVMNNKKIKGILSVCSIVSILLAKHSVEIKDIKKTSSDLQENIYRILISPTPDRKNADFFTEAENCFNNLSFIINGTCTVFSYMNKCVTLIDESMINLIKSSSEKRYVYENAIDIMRNGIEFAINILILKKINNQYTFYKKENYSEKIAEIQNEYNRNIIYISSLLSGPYGSVREQVEAFEENMKYFVDHKNINERMEALNNILEQKNADKLQKFQNALSIGGLIFSVFFGLPSITDTVTVLRTLPFFTQADIPIISINTVSVGIWILINIIISCFIFSKNNKD